MSEEIIFEISMGFPGEDGKDGDPGSVSFADLLTERDGSLVVDRNGEPVFLRS